MGLGPSTQSEPLCVLLVYLSAEWYDIMFVTSFSSISYCSNSEYWFQKCAQSGNIHSVILDIHNGEQN